MDGLTLMLASVWM